MTSTGSNWPVGKEAGRHGRAEKLWRVEKSEEVGFKARKKMITRKRVLCKGLMTVVAWCVCQEQRMLDLLVENSKAGRGVAE